MKKLTVVIVTMLSLALAGYAEAAKPRKRTRNANRVGPYGAFMIGDANYSGDHSSDEQSLVDTLEGASGTVRNISSSTEDSAIGYHASFGYRFNRYFAAELGLAQMGKLVSRADGEIDFNDGNGFLPATLKLSFSVGGPVMSAVGFLPINQKLELFGRLGYLFASSDRAITSRLDGQSGGFGSAKGDSQNVIYGIGAAWHLNQIYSIRAEYDKLGKVGQSNRTGTEELSVAGIGLIVRF